MKKFVLKLDLEADDKEKQRRALKTVGSLSGIDEITVDAKAQKLLVIGTVDPITVVSKLRKKNWQASIISVGPAKEPEKKEEPKKDEAKKDEPAKEEGKKDEAQKEEPKKEEAKKEEPKKDEDKKPGPELVVGTAMPYRPYYPPMNTYYPPTNAYYYVHHSAEENPTGCAIC